MQFRKGCLEFVCIVFLCFTPAVWACGGIEFNFATLIKQTHQFKSVELIRGKMNYQETQDEHYTAGYRPDAMSVVEGDVCVSVYDLPEGYRAHDAFKYIKLGLEQRGSVLFECLAEQCGDIDGWKLYLDPLIEGQSDHQYYLFSGYGNPTSGDFVMADMLHVSEFDQQTRVAHVSYISTHLSGVKDVDLVRQTVGLGGNPRLLGSVYFSSGQANISGEDNASMLEALQQLQSDERVLLVGFADQAGSAERNLILSRERAESVEQLLRSKTSLSPQQFVLIPSGETHSSGGLSQARRVDVYAISTTSLTANNL